MATDWWIVQLFFSEGSRLRVPAGQASNEECQLCSARYAFFGNTWFCHPCQVSRWRKHHDIEFSPPKSEKLSRPKLLLGPCGIGTGFKTNSSPRSKCPTSSPTHGGDHGVTSAPSRRGPKPRCSSVPQLPPPPPPPAPARACAAERPDHEQA